MKKNCQNGFSLIELCFVVVILGIIAAIAMPNLFASRRAANEAAAISSLRTISSSQETFESTVGEGDFGDLNQLVNAGLLDPSFTSSGGVRSGYQFLMNSSTRAANNGMGIFNAQALPAAFGTGFTGTGARYFYVNETGVIYQSETQGVIPFAVSNSDRAVTGGSPVE